jgi:hypothetical protein
MALKKKGTPEKISTLNEAELKQLRALISKALQADFTSEQVFKVKKNSK